MKKPESNSMAAWVGAAMQDYVDSAVKITKAVADVNNPQWASQVMQESWEMVSLKRWAFLLPGGGAARGARKPPVAVRQSAAPRQAAATAAPNQPPVVPPPAPTSKRVPQG